MLTVQASDIYTGLLISSVTVSHKLPDRSLRAARFGCGDGPQALSLEHPVCFIARG